MEVSRPGTECPRQGIKPAPLQRPKPLHLDSYPLCHSGNSRSIVKRVNPKSSHHKENFFFFFLYNESIWDHGYCDNDFTRYKSNLQAICFKFTQWCISSISQIKLGEKKHPEFLSLGDLTYYIPFNVVKLKPISSALCRLWPATFFVVVVGFQFHLYPFFN